MLLDRLVRQGRAFGIHVLLGSQTLGGAYTLARSTIGQMAVRIALQCSEADAHLILSEDNTAARLLTRPGEAIYNDANGLYEGNHPFQIVWLDDHRRDDYLKHISQLAQQRHVTPPPPIVFEGNVLADLADNPILKGLIESREWPERSPATPAWLGSAVAIKDPTNAVFLRQNGSNVLMVGHREEAALGVLASPASSVWPLSTDRGNETVSPLPTGEGTGAKFYILDGMRSDAPEFGFWKRLADAVPQTVKIAGIREPPRSWPKSPPIWPRVNGIATTTCRPFTYSSTIWAGSASCEGGRFQLFQQRRTAGEPGQAVYDDPARRPAAGDSHRDLVRHLQQRRADARSAELARFRDANPLPNERQRFEQLDGLARGQPAGRSPRDSLRRRPRPNRKVPPLRFAFRRVFGLGEEALAGTGIIIAWCCLSAETLIDGSPGR